MEKKVHELPSRTKTIKVEVRTWDSLKRLKNENETFNDAIKDLLMERTKSAGNENIKAIQYQRRTAFFTSWYKEKEIGFEFEYNDAKGNKSDFVLDVKIKKVFFNKRVLNPSEFFGVDNTHKHYSNMFIVLYLQAVALALRKEFRSGFLPYRIDEKEYGNIAVWRKFYYDYDLSDESFKQDVEEPLRLNETEKPSKVWQERINKSVVEKI